ncbi:hypothetical protein ACK08B_14600 [Pantoea dispersa]|uniref:hypothetical protein n=1 Tax=Pantoea dispersa TaxID=59814 RepID=UPI00398A212D
MSYPSVSPKLSQMQPERRLKIRGGLQRAVASQNAPMLPVFARGGLPQRKTCITKAVKMREMAIKATITHETRTQSIAWGAI